MSSSQVTRMTIGDLLLRRMAEAGTGHVFGVPDDDRLGQDCTLAFPCRPRRGNAP